MLTLSPVLPSLVLLQRRLPVLTRRPTALRSAAVLEELVRETARGHGSGADQQRDRRGCSAGSAVRHYLWETHSFVTIWSARIAMERLWSVWQGARMGVLIVRGYPRAFVRYGQAKFVCIYVCVHRRTWGGQRLSRTLVQSI